ncbi:CHAT domain-containing protein [Streptomyces sp. NPDC058442]|uniref:CHAT domain-containing tetratricopeptide repeat protein n=1 Tax=Streptomyces sp. NPDC058442 TaxID=3346503 RepID=UPI00365772D3
MESNSASNASDIFFARFIDLQFELNASALQVDPHLQEQYLSLLPQGLAAAERAGDRDLQASLNGKLGLLSMEASSLPEPLLRLQIAVTSLRKAIENTSSDALREKLFANLSVALLRRHKIEPSRTDLTEALEASTSAVQLAERLENAAGVFISLQNRGNILRNLNENTGETGFIRRSARDFARALILATSHDDVEPNGVTDVKIQLAGVLLECYLQGEQETRAHAPRERMHGRSATHSPTEISRLAAEPDLDPAEYLNSCVEVAREPLAAAEPESVQDLAFRIGYALANEGKWADACSHFKTCAATYWRPKGLRTEAKWVKGDDLEFRLSGRWASYCAAMDGKEEEAIELLESSIGDYLLSLEHDNTTQPGTENNFQSPSMQQVAKPQHPLVYLICAPWGVIALVNRGAESGMGLVHCPFTGKDVAELVTGFRTDMGPPTENLGFLLAKGHKEVKSALDECSAFLGQTLLESLANELTSTAASAATIIPTGFSSYLPIHVMPFQYQGVETCLWEIVEICYLPTPRLQCPDRPSAPPYPDRLVVITGVDPDRGLADGDREMMVGDREIRMIEEIRGSGLVKLRGSPELRTSLRQALSVPCDLHISAHGSAISGDAGGAVLAIQDQTISFQDLITLRGTAAVRIAVLAACSSGFQNPVAALDEELSFQAGLLFAGATGVVAANWPVNDVATYLLFGRFYTNLYKRRMSGKAALREAALWLKNLPDAKAQRLLACRSVSEFSDDPMPTE